MHEYCNILGRHLICSTQICIVGVATSVQIEQGVGMRSRLYVAFFFYATKSTLVTVLNVSKKIVNPSPNNPLLGVVPPSGRHHMSRDTC